MKNYPTAEMRRYAIREQQATLKGIIMELEKEINNLEYQFDNIEENDKP